MFVPKGSELQLHFILMKQKSTFRRESLDLIMLSRPALHITRQIAVLCNSRFTYPQ
jgi:hypothetical protein